MALDPSVEFSFIEQKVVNITIILPFDREDFEDLPALRTQFENKFRHVVIEIRLAHHGVQLHADAALLAVGPDLLGLLEVMAALTCEIASHASANLSMEFVIRCIDGKAHPIDQVAPLVKEILSQTGRIGDDASGESHVLGGSEQVAQERAERGLATDEGDLVRSGLCKHLGDGDCDLLRETVRSWDVLEAGEAELAAVVAPRPEVPVHGKRKLTHEHHAHFGFSSLPTFCQPGEM